MRGEHFCRSLSLMPPAGSSPHARGAPHDSRHLVGRDGIIPACAGSTAAELIGEPWNWDHPRMRGEHPPSSESTSAMWGSSPHARGAPSYTPADGIEQGIIPACAGSTPLTTRLLLARGDHPRMRGEHAPDNASATRSRGSSPHARGAPLRPFRPPGGVGIIPACAGSTRRSNSLSYSSGDHPRMRGEHT